MIIKICKTLLYVWLISFTANVDAKEIVIKETNWSHPVLGVLKKNKITLSKIRYFRGETCPVFHVAFPTSPRNKNYTKIYEELLKANSNFPYALVDIKDDLMVNVGWSDDVPSKMEIDLGSILTVPHCYVGSRTISFKFKMNPTLKKNILNSPFKALIKRSDGKEVMAYLYAEDGKTTSTDCYPIRGDETKETISTYGSFYIYLYDLVSDNFYSHKIAAMYPWRPFAMDQCRSTFTVLHHNKKHQSDVLLISTFVTSDRDQYEAYGFSEDQKTLKKYRFIKKEKGCSVFTGEIIIKGNIAYAYTTYPPDEEKGSSARIEQFNLSISDKPEEINVEPVKNH